MHQLFATVAPLGWGVGMILIFPSAKPLYRLCTTGTCFVKLPGKDIALGIIYQIKKSACTHMNLFQNELLECDSTECTGDLHIKII